MAIRSTRRPTYRPIVSTDTRLRDTQITQDPNFINESGKVLLVIKEPW